MAEWLGKGLQNPVQRFKSAPGLQFFPKINHPAICGAIYLCQRFSALLPRALLESAKLGASEVYSWMHPIAFMASIKKEQDVNYNIQN